MSLEFDEIPILDWSLAKRDKPAFLLQLRNAMINVGFVYLSNHSVPMDLVDNVCKLTKDFFALPQAVKDEIDMSQSPHFHGYLRVGGVDGHKDTREQFNFGGDRVCRYEEGAPEYLKLQGNALWPKDDALPGFRKVILEYYEYLETLSFEFTACVSEALGLGPDALYELYGSDRSKLQPRCKLMLYPAGVHSGISPHFDKSILTYLLQVDEQPGLEVLNHSGEWVKTPPVRGTFVINLGSALEKATQGVLTSTVHRVEPPPSGARCSIAFFSSLAMHIRIADVKYEFPEEVLAMKKAREERTGKRTDFRFTENDRLEAAEAVLEEKIKTHPLATLRFYPKLFDKYYPQGLPAHVPAHYY
ncbi:hypothetical protein C8F01DRAFT_108092 [Mycena amicta]|nr:hypothetical protein C8F01DRAFT_108092 [Mycena amicta]